MSETPNEFPVKLTESAENRIKTLVARDGRPDVFLRVGVKGGGCSGYEYVLKLDDKARENDLVLERDGFKIACDPKSAKFLVGAELTYTGNLIGGGFQFDNPNADRSCGCGSSFTMKTA